ncbi:MAG: MFS transporter [Calditrichaeota bacterium]|nr:MAG: MFS transporter [Calditrichota bacterium]
MSKKVYSQLSIMMFLQFFVWGAWAVTLGTFLNSINFSGDNIGNAYLTTWVAAIFSPFFIGIVADRFFSSEKVMGTLHLIGAVVMYFAAETTALVPFILLMLIFNLCYMPTLALVNAISFNQMESPDKEFPKVRVWGTLGWIVAGLVISFVLGGFFKNVEATAIPMKMAAAASLIMGLYSFSLPNTPPKDAGKKFTISDILGLKALKLMKERSFLVFTLSSLLICIPLAFYYSFANLFFNNIGMEYVAAKQSLGQMSEVLFMLVMPFFFVRLGVKKMLLVGMIAWVVRYAMFALGDLGANVWMLYGGILLHGICYDFFFVTGQIYVDKVAGIEIRASAQGFIALVTYGIGMSLGTKLAGKLVDMNTAAGIMDWPTIWWIPCIFAAAISLLFLVTFNDKSADKAQAQIQ